MPSIGGQRQADQGWVFRACSISMADKVGFRFSERLCLKGIHGRTTRQDIQQPSLASVHTGMRRHKHKGIPRGLTFKVFVFYLTEYTSVHAHHTDTPTHKYRTHTHIHTYKWINKDKFWAEFQISHFHRQLYCRSSGRKLLPSQTTLDITNISSAHRMKHSRLSKGNKKEKNNQDRDRAWDKTFSSVRASYGSLRCPHVDPIARCTPLKDSSDHSGITDLPQKCPLSSVIKTIWMFVHWGLNGLRERQFEWSIIVQIPVRLAKCTVPFLSMFVYVAIRVTEGF